MAISTNLKLSVIIPAYNEQATIFNILQRVSAVELIQGIEKEMVVVNDCSKDGTEAELMRFRSEFPGIEINYQKHEVNRGKGAALRTGI
jgi:glycosyltransferase involved in cell wall biosynthesis